MKKLLVILCFILLTACGHSAPTHYYTLDNQFTVTPNNVTYANSKSIMLGPITIPKTLQKPQMMLTDGNNHLYYSDFNYWASPLKDNIKTVMLKNMIAKLPRYQWIEYPGSLSDTPNYRVEITILNFDTTLSGLSRLTARYSLLNKNKKIIYGKTVQYTQQIPMPITYDAVAKGMSVNLGRLSSDISVQLSKM